MLKKLIALGLLAVLLAAPLSCLGETFRIEQLMAYQSGISAVSGQPYVLITDKRGTQKAVFSTDGTQLTDYLHNANPLIPWNAPWPPPTRFWRG